MQTISSPPPLQAEVIVNNNFESVRLAEVYGKRHSATAGLVWGYYGGLVNSVTVADGTVTLTNAATNYIVAARATWAVSVSTAATNWNNQTSYKRLHKLVTAGGVVTGWEDHRAESSVLSHSLNDLTDVDIGSPGPANGTVLTYTNGLASFQSAPSGQGIQSIPVMATAMMRSTAGGCAPLAVVASAANQPDITTLDFDPATEEYAQFSIPMPKKWNLGTISARFLWSHAATVTNFSAVWAIQALALSDDDAIAQAFGAAQTATDVGGTTNDIYRSAATPAMTVAGTPVAEDVVFFRVYRKAADAADTMTIDARLHGVVLYVTTNADTDA